MAGIGRLEAAVSAAPNTKTEVKTNTRDLAATLREFFKVSKALGLTRNGDISEQRLAAILQAQQQQQQLQRQQYQQQQQQHQQMIEASAQTSATLAEIQRQIAAHEGKLTAMTEAPESHQAGRRQHISIEQEAEPAQPTTQGDVGQTTAAPHSWTDVVRRKSKKNAVNATPAPGTATSPPLASRPQSQMLLAATTSLHLPNASRMAWTTRRSGTE